MMKKLGPLLFFLLIVSVSAWWSLQNQQPDPPKQDVLDIWATFGDDPDWLENLFNRYGSASGTKIRVTTRVRYDELVEALGTDRSPDLVILSGAGPVATLSEQGLVEPIDNWGNTTGLEIGDFYPAALDPCLAGSRLNCLPWASDVELLYWNKDLFEAAGLDPDTPPQTMEQLLEYARALTLRDGEGELLQAGFIPDLPRPHTGLFRLDEDSNSASVTDSAAGPQAWLQSFNAIYRPGELDDFIATFTPYQTSSHPVFAGARMSCRQCHRNTIFAGKKTPDLGLFEGRVAMMVDGSWQLGGGIFEENGSGANFGVAPLPPSGPQSVGLNLAEGPVVIIPTAAVDKEAAYRLLDWMVSPEIMLEATDGLGSLPARRSAAEGWPFHPSESLEMALDLLALAAGGPTMPAAGVGADLRSPQPTLSPDRGATDAGPGPENSDLVYAHQEFGFQISFPASWTGYQIAQFDYEGRTNLCFSFPEAGPTCVLQIDVYTPEAWEVLEKVHPDYLLGRTVRYMFGAGPFTAECVQMDEFQCARYTEIPDILDSFSLE